MLQKARNLSAPGVWFLTVRLAEVGVIALLVGAVLEARYAWQVGAQFSPNGPVEPGASPSLMQRISGMALFGGYRMPVSLLVVVLGLAALVVVLHRCQPVSHTRVLRWEWFVLWGAATLLALVASVIGAVALVAKDPTAPSDPTVVTGSLGPGYREQVLGNLSWPLGALLLLLPLGLWWARLPDADDLDDTVAEAAGAQPEGVAAQEASAARSTATEGPRAPREADRDAIVLDDVEQIAPVERLEPRADARGDGSTSSGYDGYFRR